MSDLPQIKEPVDRTVRLLLVAEDPISSRRIEEILRRPGGTPFDITHVPRIEDALELLLSGSTDVVLLDLSIHEAEGLDSLLRARVAARSVPVVVLTYQRDEEIAVKAVRAGAQDYLAKGEVTPELLSRTLLHAMERHRMMRELTDAKQREHFLATHDALTKLPNRYSFVASLDKALANAARDGSQIAVMFFDLDGFKAINDNLGHAVGDELLTDVASRMRRIIRKSDLVARLGGDEFVAAIRSESESDAPLAVAEKIRETIEEPYHLQSLECWVTTSIGISLYPRDGDHSDILIRCADTAMYHAKSSGRNQVRLFDAHMNEALTERFNLVNGLREAIHGGHLVLAFQPQIDVDRETLVGAETLVRWRHPVRGLISPVEFIETAEDTGLMVPLGDWVLRNACRAAASWGSLPGARVAVNVSERQLEQNDFAQRVRLTLEESGLSADRLELELTESVAASDGALEVLKELRDMGLRTAIDDFGTGYSSLNLLKRLPVDTLKFDRSFLHGAVGETADAVILEAMIRMAHGLGLEVVAEGVETLEEMDTLRDLGCRLMQGFLFSRPIPKRDFEQVVFADDAAWRLPIARPQGWTPVDAMRETADDFGDEHDLPGLREEFEQPADRDEKPEDDV